MLRARPTVPLTAHRRMAFDAAIGPESQDTQRSASFLLHSFAHAVIRQLAVECGYTAASIRERIYSSSGQDGKAPMAGVLIYTAAPDSEGTLMAVGLVSLGEPENLSRHLDQALDGLRFANAQPIRCAQNLCRIASCFRCTAGACHACLFAPETSCERGNKYPDRSTLTVLRSNVRTGRSSSSEFHPGSAALHRRERPRIRRTGTGNGD